MDRTKAYGDERDKQVTRYLSMSRRYLQDSLQEARLGRWKPSEELLWGSLTAGVKAIACSRGVTLGNGAEIEKYAASLATETKDRRVGEAFGRLSGSYTLFDRFHESRDARRRLAHLFEDISSAVENLWMLVPAAPGEAVDEDEDEDFDYKRRR